MNIIVRSDSSSTIGTGHIMRDLVLVKKLSVDHSIMFATQNLPGNINDQILKEGYPLYFLSSNDLNDLILCINQYQIDMVIIDHYGIDAIFEKKLKKKTAVKILSFDDMYLPHHCDILLNHNISANKKRYEGLVPKYCELQCGSQYTLLRDEFLHQKIKSSSKIRKQKQKHKIFVAMGGADTAELNIKILKVLRSIHSIEVDMVTTTANVHIKKLKKFVKYHSWINLHVNTSNIASIMNQSDFAVVTPSVVVNEIFYLEIPFIAIKVAKNQEDLYSYLKKKKIPCMSKFKDKQFNKWVQKLKDRMFYKTIKKRMK